MLGHEIKKANFDTKTREIRIPLGCEVFPTCPILGGDLNIKIFIPTEDLRGFISSNQVSNPAIRYCEFGWSSRSF